MPQQPSKPKPLSLPGAWDLVSAGYLTDTMPLLAQYSQTAMELAGLDPAHKIVDVACGPGTLTIPAARQVSAVEAVDFSPNMITLLKDAIGAGGIDNITAVQGDGQNLPYEDASFDRAFSMFGLMFFPDINRGFQELHRVLKPNGRAIVSSWRPVAHSPAMQMMFGAIRAANPQLPEPQTAIESLENPEFFRRTFSKAGFDVEVTPVTHEFPVTTVEEFWAGMVRGSAPIQLMKKGMSAEEWTAKEKKAVDYLQNELTELPTGLGSEALIAVGTKR